MGIVIKMIIKANIDLRILPNGCCHCALASMRVRKHLLVTARCSTVCGELLHRVAIASSQRFLVVPINGCGTAYLESKMRYLSARKLRDTHAYTATKNREGETVSLNTAPEYEAPF
jgi:hypothetical protein